MKPLTSGAYAELLERAYKYASIVDVRGNQGQTVVVIKPFKHMQDADVNHSIMGLEDTLIAETVRGTAGDFAIEYIL